MKTTYSEKVMIKFHESDFMWKVKLVSLMDYIQHIGEVHGTSLGLGYEGMMERGLFWVVSRMKINIYRYPKVCEEITIQTELAGREKLFWVRRFIIFDSNEEVIGEAMLYYLILDAETRFPQKPSVCPVNVDIDVDNKGHEVLRKLRMPGEAIEEKHRELYYNYIDANGHVNNAKYISFVEDFFSLEWHEKHDITSVQINFIKEIKPDDKLKLKKFIDDKVENTYFINGVSEESLQEFFQCKLTYRKHD